MTDWQKQYEEAERSRDQTAREHLEQYGDEMCRTAEDFLYRAEEYENTHQYAPNHAHYFESGGGFGIQIPLKFKSNGEMVKWPDYGSNPPGLYEVKDRGGYVYVEKDYYGLMLTIIGRLGYNSVEEFVYEYCGGGG